MSTDSLRQQLQARADELGREIAARREAGDALPRDVGDLKDEADERIRTTVDDAEVERDLAELRDTEAALQRLAEGRYGLCLDCGEAIPAARLAAQPAALRCIACQSARERP